MTIAMFSLIVFSLVMMATINHNFVELMLGDEANAGWDVRADMPRHEPDRRLRGGAPSARVSTPADSSERRSSPYPHVASQARLAGDGEWKDALVRGMDDDFIDAERARLPAAGRGVRHGRRDHPGAADSARTSPSSTPRPSRPKQTSGGDADLFTLEGVETDDKVFAPITIQVDDPDSQTPATLTIIGVIDAKIGSLFGIYANQRDGRRDLPLDAAFDSYFVALSDPEQADTTAKAIEAALLTNGVQATSIRDELKEAQQQATGFLYIFEGFMGLGLLVGVAAVGVIAFRSVVERRQQIGVLRALGYRREMVARAFMIETGFVVGIGGPGRHRARPAAGP